jgi:acetyltransferase-like isoleucine patch superfamily enzyme
VLLLFALGTLILVERASMGFRRMSPRFCSIYDPYFWHHERFWKLTTNSAFDIFNGTALKGVVWRLLGVRTGRRVFDDGCSIPEKSLVTIGDDCALNSGTALWGHSLEDGTFKSDRIDVGDGCTLGVGAFVLYGVTMGDGSTLDPDAFLMKGEEVEPGTRWVGNPAREVPEGPELPSLPAVRPSMLVPLVLAGLLAVTLPAGVLMGVRGTTLPFVPAAVTATPTATPVAPADDAVDDDAADSSGLPGAEDPHDADDEPGTVAVTPAVARPAVARPAAARATAATTTKARAKSTTTKVTAVNATTTQATTTKATPTSTSKPASSTATTATTTAPSPSG